MGKYFKASVMAVILLCMILILPACGVGKEQSDGNTVQSAGNMQNEPSVELGKELEWPKDMMGDLPEPKGKITAVIDDKTAKQCTVAFGEMSEEEAETYAKKIEELGYTGGMNLSDKDIISVNGENADGSKADFVYNITAKEGVISFQSGDAAQSGISGGETASSEPADMTDLAPWPSDYIAGVPELQGKIIDIVENDASISVDLEYVDKADFENYIKLLKENGYTVDADETSGLNAIDYRAYNNSGEWVHAYWSIGEDKNTASVMMEKAE